MADNAERRHPRIFISTHGRTQDEVVAAAMRYMAECREREARWKEEDRAGECHEAPDGGTPTE